VTKVGASRPRLGVVFPQLEIGADPRVIRAFAVRVEELGYRHLIAYDHVLGADPDRDDPRMEGWPAAHYSHRDAFHEPLTLFAHLAAVTATLEFATGVLILPQRQTALVAKQVAELVLLSGNRFRLGVGVGWNQFEYESLAVPWERRGRRLEEQLEVLERLLGEELVEFEGDFHRLDRVGLRPLPVGGPLPIWMGAKTPAGFRRLARHAVGYISPAPATAPELPGWIAILRAALEEAERDPSQIGLEGRLDLCDRSDAEALEELELWHGLGATHVSVQTMVPPARRAEPHPPGWHLERVESFIAAAEGVVR